MDRARHLPGFLRHSLGIDITSFHRSCVQLLTRVKVLKRDFVFQIAHLCMGLYAFVDRTSNARGQLRVARLTTHTLHHQAMLSLTDVSGTCVACTREVFDVLIHSQRCLQVSRSYNAAAYFRLRHRIRLIWRERTLGRLRFLLR